jgi:hypothetical protein
MTQEQADQFLTDCAALLDKPRITVPDVVPLVYLYYRMLGNSNGGSLHIVTEDQNITDDNIKFVSEYAQQRGDKHGVALAMILLRMSRTQRLKIASRAYYPWMNPS